MTRATHYQNDFANALKEIRQACGVSQEAFSLASSRTYVSVLERGIKTPTLNKVDDLAEVLGVHPLTLLALAYVKGRSGESAKALLLRVQSELSDMSLL